MVSSSLSRSLLLLALGFSHQVAAACTRSVTAQQGDTCATLASQAGVTVTDFLRSNPAVTSCSQLVVGGSYCVDGTADSDPELQVSTDGSCGQGVTCAGSRFGTCCSAHGFCGSTGDYCGDGCQAAFGTCGGGGGETSAAGSVTVTVTTLTGITRTSVVYQTSTITNVVTQTRTAATATVTQTVKTTATVPATATTTVTSTARVTSIVTNVRTSISITTSTSITRTTSIITSVSTRTINLTSLSIDTITSTVLSTRVVTSAACNTTPTRTTGRVTTTTAAQGERPTLPGTPSYCRNYDEIEKNDSCRSIATRNDLSLLEFYQLNPSVSATILTLGDVCTPEFTELVLIGLCQINCDALWEGYYVCVGR